MRTVMTKWALPCFSPHSILHLKLQNSIKIQLNEIWRESVEDELINCLRRRGCTRIRPDWQLAECKNQSYPSTMRSLGYLGVGQSCKWRLPL